MSAFSIDLDLENGYLRIGNFPIPIDMIQNWIGKLIKIALIIIILTILTKVGYKIINKVVKRQIESNKRFTLDEKKAYTFGSVLKSILKYTSYFIGFTAILTVLFGNISITFASVGGVAIGFGAQNLVKDIINGLFILFENQFSVGDYVTIGNYKGTVENIGLRSTILKDFSGDVHILPNSIISEVTNHSIAESRVMVDVEIAYEENVDNAMKVIEDICNEFKLENENMVDGPRPVGVVNLKSSSVTIRVLGKAKPMTQWGCENELRRRIKIGMDKSNIEIPYPKTQLVPGKKK
ncbi:mechanosensitive ion channel family protein [Clostridium polynesiense]|uniref:mechanosensitive ion channel family protein n=1 Tax=Clostridium polynesiense TaxID=1325933 RepID=UPI000693DAD4|nr:mechanosensitive ion channel family protein [Clostridium polynesiense]